MRLLCPSSQLPEEQHSSLLEPYENSEQPLAELVDLKPIDNQPVEQELRLALGVPNIAAKDKLLKEIDLV